MRGCGMLETLVVLAFLAYVLPRILLDDPGLKSSTPPGEADRF